MGGILFFCEMMAGVPGGSAGGRDGWFNGFAVDIICPLLVRAISLLRSIRAFVAGERTLGTDVEGIGNSSALSLGADICNVFL